MLYYNKRFANHFINLSGGLDVQEQIAKLTYYQLEGFNIGSLNKPIYAAQQPQKTKETESTTRTFGWLAALNYTLMRYICWMRRSALMVRQISHRINALLLSLLSV